MRGTMKLSRCLSDRRNASERGAALLLAIVLLFLLTTLGLSLLLTTTTEVQIAGAETTINRTFYSADSGVEFGTAQLRRLRFSGACTYTLPDGTARSSFWCFKAPGHLTADPADADPTNAIAVGVSPLRLVDRRLSPGSQFNLGSVELYELGFHYDSYANDSKRNSHKQIAVEVSAGPMPFSIERDTQ
jgi:hypothetical protein